MDLANPSVVRWNLGVPPGDKPEIDNGDEICLENLNQFIHNEACTIWAEWFIVKRQIHLVFFIIIGRWKWNLSFTYTPND